MLLPICERKGENAVWNRFVQAWNMFERKKGLFLFLQEVSVQARTVKIACLRKGER
jgi:hypothetical protein